MRWILGAAVVAVVMASPWILAKLARRYGTDDTPVGTHSYRFEGHDEALQTRTAERRRLAEDIKREGRQIETRDDRASKIHLVG